MIEAMWVRDDDFCEHCGCVLEEVELVLCTDCLHDAWYSEDQELEASWFWWDDLEVIDELPHLEVSPLALPRNEKPKREEKP